MRPFLYIAEDARSVVTENGVPVDAADAGYGHVAGIDIADKCKGGIFGQGLLEFVVGRSPGRRIVCAAGTDQRPVHPFVGVARIIGSFSGAEYLVRVIVGVEGASPADEVCHLVLPVHPDRDIHGDVHACGPQLLRRDLCHVGAHLIAGADADSEGDFFSVPVKEAVIFSGAAGFREYLPGLFRIVGVMIYIFIIVYVSLERTVGGDAFAQENGVDDGLAVDGVTDGRDQVAVFLPVFVLEIEEDAAVIGGFPSGQ